MPIPVAPKNRQALFEMIAEQIGWGASADDVENLAEQFEAAGVCFAPRAGTAAMNQAAGLPGNENILSRALAYPANPYAPAPAEASNGN